MNKEIIETIKSTKTVDELKEVANKHGYKLTDEEVETYFEAFHNEGKITDDELNNIAGGACSLTRNGRFYCGEGNHHLIVTAGNRCDSFETDEGQPGFGTNCYHCKHSYIDGASLYCESRSYDYDPYNPVGEAKRQHTIK